MGISSSIAKESDQYSSIYCGNQRQDDNISFGRPESPDSGIGHERAYKEYRSVYKERVEYSSRHHGNQRQGKDRTQITHVETKGPESTDSGIGHTPINLQSQHGKCTLQSFTTTNNDDKLKSILQKHRIVILTGCPGDGKSYAAFRLIKSMQENNGWNTDDNEFIRKPLYVYQMHDVLNVGEVGNRVIMVDGIFDHIKFDVSFQESIYALQSLLDDGSWIHGKMLLIVMQKEVINFLRFQCPSIDWIDEKYIVDFSRQLSLEEKKTILETHCVLHTSLWNNIAFSDKKIFGFPRCCKQFGSLKAGSKDIFLAQSVKILEHHFSTMDVRCLFVLGMMFMNEGKLTEKEILRGPKTFPFSENLTTICGKSILDNVGVNTILMVARSFLDVYFVERKLDNQFIFIESQVSDAVACVLFQRDPCLFIESCPMYFLQKYISRTFLKENNVHLSSVIHTIVRRYCSELQTHPTSALFKSVWQSDIFSSKYFFECKDKSLAMSISGLQPHFRSMFFNCSRVDNHCLISYLLISLPSLSYGIEDHKAIFSFHKYRDTGCRKIINGECACKTLETDWKVNELFNVMDLHPVKRNTGKSIFLFNESVVFAADRESSSEQLSLDLHGLVRINSYKLHLQCGHTLAKRPNCGIWKTLAKTDCQCLCRKGEPFNPFLKQMLEKGLEMSCSELMKIALACIKQDSFSWLKNVVHKVISRGDINLTKKLLKEVSQSFRRLYMSGSVVRAIWFGRENCFELPSIVDSIIYIVDAPKPRLDDSNFLGLRIIIRTENAVDPEEKLLMSYETKMDTHCPIQLNNKDVSSLFKAHSNITMIRTSNVCFLENDEHKSYIERMPCIVIFCRVKGVIPLGEHAFPRCLDCYKVDVREGACSFAANPLHVGEGIKSEMADCFGTLGGFVDIDTKRKGFLTCAHVVFKTDYLKNGSFKQTIKRCEVRISEGSGGSELKSDIGIVHDAAFLHKDPNSVSIDAALVEITNRYPENGLLLNSITPRQLRNAGFVTENALEYTNGETEKISQHNCRKQVIKIGAMSGLTSGYIRTCDTHAKITESHAEIGAKDIFIDENTFAYEMYKQIEICPQDEGSPFLFKGDSGAFIFMITNNDPLVLKCIGMAVAVTSYGSCIMTPINDILEALGLSPDCLSKFTPTFTGPSHDSSLFETFRNSMMTDFKKLLSNHLDKTMATLASKEDVQKIDQRLKALEKSVKK